jgi:hypothetical protein
MQYKSITLTPEMTALDVMTTFRSDNTISDAGAWTIFEVIVELDLGKVMFIRLYLVILLYTFCLLKIFSFLFIYTERPLRDWESVAWVIRTWELGKKNYLVLKKYAHRNALTLAVNC